MGKPSRIPPATSSVQDFEMISDDRLREIVRRQIHFALNVERSHTRMSLAAESGVNIHTIDALISRAVEKKRPLTLAVALSLMVVLGQRAVNAVLATIGYVATPVDEPEEPKLASIVADGLKHFSTIAAAAADGRIDHIEAPLTTEAADRIIEAVLPLSSAGAAE